MIRRYPHIAKIVVSLEIEKGSIIPDVEDYEIIIPGRYEPSTQSKSLNYSSKFYCPKNVLKQFEVD